MRRLLPALLVTSIACGGTAGAGPDSTAATTPATVTTTGPTTTPPPVTPPSVASTIAATTSSTLPASPVPFDPLGDGEVLVEATQRYNNPGVVLVRDGTWHMFSNDFRAWPGIVKVRHYTSSNGITWEEATGTVFTSERSPFGTPQITLGGFVSDDDTWTLYFHTFAGSTRPAVIGRATAPAPEGPWTVHEEPVLTPGDEGAWDDLRVTRPSVVVVGDELYMYYAGEDATGATGVGLATSTDGLEWTKRPEPVLVPEGWEDHLERPDVVLTDDGFVMIYRGSVGGPMGLATSADGVEWARVSDEPVFVEGREVPGSFWQGELAWTPLDGLRFYLEAGGGRQTNVYGWSFTLP